MSGASIPPGAAGASLPSARTSVNGFAAGKGSSTRRHDEASQAIATIAVVCPATDQTNERENGTRATSRFKRAAGMDGKTRIFRAGKRQGFADTALFGAASLNHIMSLGRTT